MAAPKPYVIEVGGAPGDCWLCEPGDEDEPHDLVTTREPDLASKWTDFSQARSALNHAVKSHPERQFKLTVFEEKTHTPPPRPVQLQVNQTGAWRSALDFDLVDAPPELLSTADQLARLTAHDRIRMRVVLCKAIDSGSHVATRNVLMHWSRPEGWVNT